MGLLRANIRQPKLLSEFVRRKSFSSNLRQKIAGLHPYRYGQCCKIHNLDNLLLKLAYESKIIAHRLWSARPARRQAISCGSAAAQSWPAKPVRVIVPFAPG